MYGIFLCHIFWDVCNYTKLTTTLVVTYQSVIPMQELNLLRGRREQTQSAKHEEVKPTWRPTGICQCRDLPEVQQWCSVRGGNDAGIRFHILPSPTPAHPEIQQTCDGCSQNEMVVRSGYVWIHCCSTTSRFSVTHTNFQHNCRRQTCTDAPYPHNFID